MRPAFNTVESYSRDRTIVWITPRPERFPDEQAVRYGLHAAPIRAAEWHGTVNGYDHHGCRCTDCKAARRQYDREWRARRRIDHGIIRRPRIGPQAGYAQGQTLDELLKEWP